MFSFIVSVVSVIVCFVLFVAGLTVLCSVHPEYDEKMLINDINEAREKLGLPTVQYPTPCKEQERREREADEQMFYHQLCAYVLKYEDAISWMKTLLEVPCVAGEKEEARSIKKCLRFVVRQGILHNAIALEGPEGVEFPQDSPLLREKMEVLRNLRNTALDSFHALKIRKANITNRLQNKKKWVFRKSFNRETYEGRAPPFLVRTPSKNKEETAEEKIQKEQERVRKKNIRNTRRATRNNSF